MEQRDYILREIEKIGMILQKIIFRLFGKSGTASVQDNKQLEETAMDLQDLADFHLAGFIQMDRQDAIRYLESQEGFNLKNIEDFSLILEKLGFTDKALWLLEYCRMKDKTYSFERENRIGTLQSRIKEPR